MGDGQYDVGGLSAAPDHHRGERRTVTLVIRQMSAVDVEAVATVHVAAFPNFFLSFLGRRFLRELYRAILDDEEGIAFVAADGDRVVGFVAGSGSAGFYRRAARRRWLRFGWSSIGALLRRPAIAPRLLRALFAPPKTASSGALLMSLAVDPRMQRSGAGRLLTSAFVERARERGAAAVVLTTDQSGNEAVNAFYRSQGFAVGSQFVTPEGRAMNEYILYIGDDQ
jgi:ribosomal protein S18 acetylase RimI-like enzyme